jgi:hypothetical protein
VTSRFERDWAAFRDVCAHLVADGSGGDPTASVDSLAWRLAKAVEQVMELEQETAVPRRLLEGPYDWEAARTMFWLFRSEVALPYRDSWSWEVKATTTPSLSSFTLLSLHNTNQANHPGRPSTAATRTSCPSRTRT